MIHIITVVALIGVAPCAYGEEPLDRHVHLAPWRVNTDAQSTFQLRRYSAPGDTAPIVFHPTRPADVFSAADADARPMSVWDAVMSDRPTGDVPVRLPQPPPAPSGASREFDAQRIASDWDADVVSLVGYSAIESDTPLPLAIGTLPLLAPGNDEPLPPPLPGDTNWGSSHEDSDGVTLGDVESIGEAVEPGTLSVLPNEVVVASVPLRERTVLAARIGAWSVDQSGSPVKVGEYQSLESSVFFDVDGLFTDGLRTWDFYGSMLDRDAPQAGFRLYGPTRSVRFDYQGYLRRLDHDPYRFFVDFNRQPPLPLPAPPANFRDMKEDLTVGDDFAIRVQELNTSFKGRLTDHLSWRLNLWAMRKHGERQAAALAHCFTSHNATDLNGNPAPGPACHILSQSQRIDWLTAEVEPVIEGRYGPVTVEYSRTMRVLDTDDQLVTRPYDQFGFAGDLPYAMVPENHTEIDRLKIGVTFPEGRHGYARLYSGRTQNEFRDTDRDFRGYDLRLTDRSVDGLTLTGYAKEYVQESEFPRFFLPEENANNIRQPINFDRKIAGFDAGWRPFYDEYSLRSRLRFNGGYEYRELERENAIFVEQAITGDNSISKTNMVYFRTGMNWWPTLESYVRYRVSFIDDPLYAVPIRNTTTNTSLPTQVHGVQIGNTWTPSPRFFLHGMLGFNNSWHSSNVADFEEDNYDLVFSAWYAPTIRWSISGGLGFYSNWIDQDITLGSKSSPLTLPWEYGGRSDVINFGTTYAWTERTTLSSALDFVRGRNAFDPLVPWPDLWSYSDVNVETTRFTMGVDYELTAQSSLYFRYQLFDYDDKAELLDSGTAEMYLFGINAYY
jgi:hypothetical protein